MGAAFPHMEAHEAAVATLQRDGLSRYAAKLRGREIVNSTLATTVSRFHDATSLAFARQLAVFRSC
jgi:hypothetical protein